jgi:hypothetical protein
MGVVLPAMMPVFNLFNPGVTILDFWQCRLLNLTTGFRNNFEETFIVQIIDKK